MVVRSELKRSSELEKTLVLGLQRKFYRLLTFTVCIPSEVAQESALHITNLEKLQKSE